MTTLADLPPGDQFLFVGLITAIDSSGFHMTLYGPESAAAATALIDTNGVMTGQLEAPANQAAVTVVTGFAPLSVGDVVVSDRTGETVVVRSAWITHDGVSMWSSTADAKVAYPATGWTVIGHVSL